MFALQIFSNVKRLKACPDFPTSLEAVGCRWEAKKSPCSLNTHAKLSSAHSSFHFQPIYVWLSGQALPMEGFGSEIEFLQSPPGPFAYDAFRCQFPGCNATYRRKEHLNRHEGSKHTKQQVFVCSSCNREFRRRYPSAYTHSLTTPTLTLER